MSESNDEKPTRTRQSESTQKATNFKQYGKGTDGPTINEKLEQEQAQGYRGTVPDPTPNENYTVSGVTSGKPTPETDREAHDALQSETRKRFTQA